MKNNAQSEATGRRTVVRRFGIQGEGMWLGEDDIWRFEDEASYSENREIGGGTPPRSCAANPQGRA
jgi:hypothetical protein